VVTPEIETRKRHGTASTIKKLTEALSLTVDDLVS